MARARNIKPALFKNEVLGTADPMLTILFCSLWCLADRDGRLEDRPLRIKAETFPYRENIDINGYLTELARLGFIHRYRCGELSIIQVLNFHKHQNPHKTEKDSELPEFTEESVSCVVTVKEPLIDVEITEAAGLIPDSLLLIPDSGLPDSAQSAVASSPVGMLPTNVSGKEFPVYGADLIVWEEAYPAVDILAEMRKIKAWLVSNPKNRKTSGGMKRFINAWLSRAQDNPRISINNQPQRQSLKDFVFDDNFTF